MKIHRSSNDEFAWFNVGDKYLENIHSKHTKKIFNK